MMRNGGGRANFIAPRATGNGGNGGAGASSAGGGSYPANPPEALLRQGTQPGMPDWANRTDNRVANLADDVGRMAHTLNDVKECVRELQGQQGQQEAVMQCVVERLASLDTSYQLLLARLEGGGWATGGHGAGSRRVPEQRERSPDPGEAEEGGAAVPTPGAQRGKQREEPRLRHWRTLETFKDLSDNFLPKTISLATMSEFVQVAGDIHCATGLALFLVLKTSGMREPYDQPGSMVLPSSRGGIVAFSMVYDAVAFYPTPEQAWASLIWDHVHQDMRPYSNPETPPTHTQGDPKRFWTLADCCKTMMSNINKVVQHPVHCFIREHLMLGLGCNTLDGGWQSFIVEDEKGKFRLLTDEELQAIDGAAPNAVSDAVATWKRQLFQGSIDPSRPLDSACIQEILAHLQKTLCSMREKRSQPVINKGGLWTVTLPYLASILRHVFQALEIIPSSHRTARDPFCAILALLEESRGESRCIRDVPDVLRFRPAGVALQSKPDAAGVRHSLQAPLGAQAQLARSWLEPLYDDPQARGPCGELRGLRDFLPEQARLALDERRQRELRERQETEAERARVRAAARPDAGDAGEHRDGGTRRGGGVRARGTALAMGSSGAAMLEDAAADVDGLQNAMLALDQERQAAAAKGGQMGIAPSQPRQSSHGPSQAQSTGAGGSHGGVQRGTHRR